MSKPSVVAVLDLETWFAVKVNQSAGGNPRHPGFNCGEDTLHCDGAVNMLCARNLTGNADYKSWWGFESCLMKNQEKIPSNAAVCAKQNGIDTTRLEDCVSGPLGKVLLNATAEKTIEYKVKWTPWFMIEGKAPPLAEINYLKEICEAYTKKGGKPLPEGCKGNLTVTVPSATHSML